MQTPVSIGQHSRSCPLQRELPAHCSHQLPSRQAKRAAGPGRPLSQRASAAATAERPAPIPKQEPAAQTVGDPQAPWYAVVANADFMLHDVQNESFAEQLRERRRLYQEQGKDIDFFLVPEPAWLQADRVPEASRVKRPSLALVSQDKEWITFMKLRLDRVLKVELGDLPRDQALTSAGSLPEYGPLDKGKWTAPYQPYRPGWWKMFMPEQ